MRLQEYALAVTPDAVLSRNRAGEVLNTYVRHKTPLQLWHRHGLPKKLYDTATRYGALWREAWQPKSPAHSDTTRIIVDGAGAPPEPFLGSAHALREIEALAPIIGDPEIVHALNRLCGQDDWPAGDKRRFKRLCRHGLERLAEYWR
ncbi:MAG: hypothetical protein KIT32_12010 [Rhodocyclaceae bacterium]|nr:hypothetical protein [Rhodocyclaceae bacterium]